jgi:uncharacterized protein (TIGR02147 family)
MIISKFDENTDPAVFLKDYYSHIKSQNPLFSLRAFAKKLKCTTSTISRVISGKRAFTNDLATRWMDSFDFNEKEKKLFYLLILKKNADSEFEKNLFTELFLHLKKL